MATRGKPMSLRQVEEARAMRAGGATWHAIAKHFGRTHSSVRHYLGVLVATHVRAPRKPRVYPPKPPKGSPEHERQRRADVERIQRHRAAIQRLTGLSAGKHRAIVTALREEAEMTGRSLDRLRLEQAVPTITQLKRIRRRLSLPTLEHAMAQVRENPKHLIAKVPEVLQN